MLRGRLHSRLLFLLKPATAARIVLFVAALGLAGQLLDINLSKVLVSSYPAMSISTVFSLFVLAMGLLFAAKLDNSFINRKRGILVSVLMVEVLVIFNLSLYLSGLPEVMHTDMPELFVDALRASSPYTLVCVVFLAASLSLQVDGKLTRRVWSGQLMALAVLAITFLCAIGYLFSVAVLHPVNQEIGMAILSLAGLTLLAIGMLNLHVEQGIPALYYGQVWAVSCCVNCCPNYAC